jgi:hypothetical protein
MAKYRFKTKPYAHQIQGVRFAFQQFDMDRGAAFLFEPRTGKTKTTIDTIGALHLKHGVRRVLVIAPNRVLGTWVQEFAIHSPLVVQCIIWDAKGRRRPLPASVAPYDIQVVIVNFEAFGTPGRKLPSGRRSKTTGRFATRDKIRKWLRGQPAVAVVDEGHKIKSASGKASMAIVSMRDDFRYRLLLTGTPITKARRAHDIYMLWQWVNPRRFVRWGPTAEAFRNHVGQWTEKNGFPQWLRERKDGMADLQRGIHKDGMVVRREDCFDLPDRMPDRIIRVRMGTATRQAYEDMAETMIAELEDGLIAEASIPLVVTLRLQQITSGFVGILHPGQVKSTSHRIGSDKLEALREILMEEVLDREEKIVVAAKYIMDLDSITKLCANLGIRMWSIRGGMHRTETDDAIRKFKVHDDAGVMLIQPDAASLGIDLSTASHMVWYSLTQSWVNWTQSCDRIALSNRATTFTYLQVPGTVDEWLYDSLLHDTNVSRAILTHPEKLRLTK